MIRDKFQPLESANKPAARRMLDPVELSRLPPIGCRVTWLGHASFLLQSAQQSFLIDPVFSSHCAPLPLPGLRRLVAPPCAIEDLPKIDAIFITHSHYDHLDLKTLRKLGCSTRIWVPQGHSTWLAKKGFSNVAEAS
ncbi:MAG: MBL fold metallo-hydrolase, partial [Luteolibacter sp.]